jgi:molybdenum cofactor cytidylyltransferase
MRSDSEQSVIALVLAAGRGTRFGSDKRQALLADGTPVLQATLDGLAPIFPNIYVVTRDGESLSEQTEGISRITSRRAHQGMGATLSDGVAYLYEHHSACALAVVLGDMPWITARTYFTLKQAATRDTIVVPCLGGQSGHPVFFGQAFWPDLMQLDGDQGARALLQVHVGKVRRIAVDDPGILLDIDEPGHLVPPHEKGNRNNGSTTA